MIWMPPNMLPMYGKDNCLEMFKNSFEHYNVKQKATVEEVVVSGDIAFSRIFSKEKFTPKGDAQAMENDGKNVFTFRRDSDDIINIVDNTFNFFKSILVTGFLGFFKQKLVKLF